MKISIATLFALASTASAFVPLATKTASGVSSRMSEEETSSDVAAPVETAEQPMAAASAAVAQPKMSQALPWMERPTALDGSMAGDVGFDPLGFAKNKEDLWNYREAEVSVLCMTVAS